MSTTHNASRRATKDIRQWYDAHGIEFQGEDWGPRSEVGESIGRQNAEPERIGREHVYTFDPALLYALEGDEGGQVMLLWTQREDHEVLAAIEAFFAPYISLMPYAKRRVLDDYLLGRRTQDAIAADLGVSQQAVSKTLRAAIRWLVRTIESDAGTDAWSAFNGYWLERFGVEWPLRS